MALRLYQVYPNVKSFSGLFLRVLSTQPGQSSSQGNGGAEERLLHKPALKEIEYKQGGKHFQMHHNSKQFEDQNPNFPGTMNEKKTSSLDMQKWSMDYRNQDQEFGNKKPKHSNNLAISRRRWRTIRIRRMHRKVKKHLADAFIVFKWVGFLK